VKSAMNKLEEFIEQNDPTVGTFLFSRSPAALEVLAEVGFDFVVIGAEHFMINPETIEQLITTAEAANIVPFVRVQENVDLIQRVLDCGAQGIVSPMINTVEQAEEVVKAAKFPPIGDRGVGNPRSTYYGIRGGDYMNRCYERQNESQVVILQIETEEAVENLEDIAKVNGVDSLFVGPWDLSHSLEQPGSDNGSGLLEKNVSEIVAKCKGIGLSAGIFAWDSKEANKRVKQGFDYTICSGDVIFLANRAREELARIEE